MPAVGNGSRNGSETSIVSMKSTITFEKQKVAPRTRTMSVQSVLSSFSLRSMLNTRDHGGSQQVNCDEEECTNTMHNHNQNNGNNNSVATTFVNPTQQIQSPAMVSTMVKKRNVVAGKNKQSFLSDLPMAEPRSRIGQQLPFTDDKRKSARDLRKTSSFSSDISRTDSNPNPGAKTKRSSCGSADATSDSTATTENNFENASSGNTSPTDSSRDSESEEDDISKQNKLTTDALRKLSLLQQSKGHVSKSLQTTPLTSSENLVDPKEPLTQLQFGGKNVILDTATTIRKNSVANESSKDQNEARKQSLEIISQPIAAPRMNSTSHDFVEAKGICANSTNSSNSKRLLQQINEPKKPMYVPAVLRDISETNITIDSMKAHSPTPSDVTQTTLQAVPSKRSNTSNTSYARSINSTTSSIVSSYRNKIQTWLYNDRDTQPQLIYPTKEHWIADSKRHSCKYCHKIFTFWERKHHCRHCGDIFCQLHVRHWLYLNPCAKFIIGSGGVGVLSKICDGCLDEYDNLVKAGPTRDRMDLQQQQQQPPSSSTSSNSSFSSDRVRVDHGNENEDNAAPLPNLSKGASGRNIDEALAGTESSVNQRQHLENIVGSVPADWSWSSF
ncbi:unnamed protein product [Kluyveromyces dobzhanskii CBS 2104]|uniref:WGS project CCBQ000000000 data, contig 00009 n=1 Tax=Kluyveromyces dobzhanskii CBS 2104 TaxID=1427455 RepID=A0A0A8L5C5_9SACH|nr:unnamed protein product [Kluyveromyces dobzhanskii CBS 2104]